MGLPYNRVRGSNTTTKEDRVCHQCKKIIEIGEEVRIITTRHTSGNESRLYYHLPLCPHELYSFNDAEIQDKLRT